MEDIKSNSKTQNVGVTPEKWSDYFKSLFPVGENNNIEQNDNILEKLYYNYDSSSLNIPICNQEKIDCIRYLKSNCS